MIKIKTKRCVKCHTDKPISEFNKAKSNKDGLRNDCKACVRVYGIAYRNSLKKEIAAKKRIYHEKNRDWVNARNKEYGAQHADEIAAYGKKYRANNKEKIAERDKKYYRKNREKISNYHRNYHADHREELNNASRVYYQVNKKKRSACHKVYKDKYPERIKANEAVKRALKTGELIRPDICSKCGRPCKPDGHHWSYLEEHWLDVEWLCKFCHKRLHAKLAFENIPEIRQRKFKKQEGASSGEEIHRH